MKKAAAILGIPIRTVRSRLSRGRETLRNLIDRGSGTKAVMHPAQKGRRAWARD